MCVAVRVLVAGLLLVDSRRVWAAPQDHAASSPAASSEEGAIDDWPDQEAAESHKRHLFREGRRQQVGAGGSWQHCGGGDTPL